MKKRADFKKMLIVNDVPLAYNWRFKLELDFLINNPSLFWCEILIYTCGRSKSYFNQI